VTSAGIAQITAETLSIGLDPGAGALTVNAAVALPSSITNLTLQSGAAIALANPLTLSTEGTLTLNSGGAVTQLTGAGVAAGTLTGQSVGGASLTASNNAVSAFGPWSDTGQPSAGIAFVNSGGLVTSGTISSASGPIALTAGDGDLTLNGLLSAASGTVSLHAPNGDITELPPIATPSLAVTAGGSASLLDANAVSNLAFSVGGSFAFRDDSTNLTIAQVV